MVQVGYKWELHKRLMRDKLLASTLPETYLWSPKVMWSMFQRYPSVILKPSGGTGGYAVFHILRKSPHQYELRYGKEKKVANGKVALERLLQRFIPIGGTKYLIQNRIPLVSVNHSPIDIRFMVQRRQVNSPWVITGHLAKIAGKGYFITNMERSRGAVIPTQQAISLAKFDRPVSVPQLMKSMSQISLRASKMVGRSPVCKAIGMDLALDRRGKIWIIEANPQPIASPAINFFKHLKDKSMYQRMIQFGYNPNK
ncbi:YheC/YheD family protein [Marininema halotolerans]|uniref:YheC/D like ATP-grasp n=1 Tax=Marininema halotolerans TaxID=1155944 RepID=A0A1I6TAK7_9BACL|nr:YheC/YheD family protein [Marininema halotolerans]SFS86254.1 YheC/D like ATP-grasp [Marininema halotolerans]